MAPPTWSTGQILTASDVNTYFVPMAAYRTADQTVTSSTTLVNDNAMFLSVAANAFYAFQAVLTYRGGTTGSSDMKWQWTVPTGATLRYAADYLSTGLTVQVGQEQTAGNVSSAGTNGSSTVFTVQQNGIYAGGSNAGTLQLQWAQNTSSGTATVMGSGSYVILQRIG